MKIQDYDPEGEAWDHQVLAKNANRPTLLLPISADAEDMYDVPTFGVVTITKEMEDNIRKWANIVKEQKILRLATRDYHMTFFSDTNWFPVDGAPQHPVEVDYPKLFVADDSFWWEGYIRHSNTPFATESVSIDGRHQYCTYDIGRPPQSE